LIGERRKDVLPAVALSFLVFAPALVACGGAPTGSEGGPRAAKRAFSPVASTSRIFPRATITDALRGRPPSVLGPGTTATAGRNSTP
jgi:hypothetical protein